MIPQITEINFPEYATLHEATGTFAEMGERVITTQVRIDGDVIPDFEGWELEFKGERFVLPVKEPQAQKNNTTRNSLVDLTFYSWPIYQMKRFFFFETTTTATGTVMADKYQASVRLNLVNFVALFNRVLDYYFDGEIVADLASGSYGTEVSEIQLDYSYLWDVLQDFYSIFKVRWYIEYDNDVYRIKIGYPAPIINDHTFEYGYEGGLLHFERQVQDDNVKNILLGRGGEKNVPYRYFKGVDPNNPEWAADPDAIPELANVYFDRIRDLNFRSYVQGWKAKHYGDTYDASRAAQDWAYKKGYDDVKFDPVEYVKDQESINKYGERWGALDDNDDIYPTIQGITLAGLGRVDEVVAVSDIVTDDVTALADDSATIVSLHGVMSQVDTVPALQSISRQIRGETFTIPTGQVADIHNSGFFAKAPSPNEALVTVDTGSSRIRVYNAATGSELVSGDAGIPAGTYYYVIDITVTSVASSPISNVTYGVNGLDLVLSDASSESWKPTFDIWIKNIWQTTKGANESEEDYALRVWQPILGDRLGNEAKVVFSDGAMAISQDYEFVIASYPVFDQSKTITGGYRSEWKITLYKSGAEYEASGLYIPNNTSGGKPLAGDHFFFTGIDMPHLYVTLAEERLNAFKNAALDQMKDVNPTWLIQLDKIRINEVRGQGAQSLFDRISAGCEMHVRDKRFTGNEILRLFANTITYTWHEPTNENPYILPDVEVVVSDHIVVEKSTVEKIQGDLDVLKATYAKMSDMEAVIQQVASPMFLRKTGETDTSLSPTKFASVVTSRDFRQGGFGGRGWGLYRDNSSVYQPELQAAPATRGTRSAGDSEEVPVDAVLEVDKLVVRKEMQVNNLVVNQISYIGGKQIISAAAIECVQVVETQSGYICYFDQKQGSVKNLFQVNDIAMGQVFTPEGVEERYYKMVVSAVDIDNITLSKTGRDGQGAPQKGDLIVQYGNTTDTDRQYVIIRDVIGGGYERMLSGLNSVSATGEEYYFAGYRPSGARFFVGGDNSNMEFSQQDGTLRIKGTIVQSSGNPAVSFPMTCYRGEYNGATPYYFGDEITYTDGCNYVYVHPSAASSGHTPSDDGVYWKKRTATGAGARLVEIVASSLFFSYADISASTPTGNSSVTLTANVQNVASPTYVWQYKNGNNWSNITGQTSSTLTINHDDSRFSNNQLQIRVIVSGDPALYDEVTLYKIYGGKDGTDGVDGVAPHIGQNGNWWIGFDDTGVSAQGEDGNTPYIVNGYWYIDGVSTGIKAEGEDGSGGITAFLTNTSHLFPAGEEVVEVQMTDSFSVMAFMGTTPLAYASSLSEGKFTIGTISGTSSLLTATKNSSTGVITVTAKVGLATTSGVLTIPVNIYVNASTTRTVNLKYSWALSFKGEQGLKGDAGARLRGPTIWNGVSPYSSGENDDFQDIVYYVDNYGDGQYYLCIADVSAGTESNPNTNPKSDTTHWQKGSHFDFVASDLSVSLRSKIVDLNVNKLTTENPNDPKAIIKIFENQMNIANSDGVDKVKITSGSLPDGGAASGSYSLSSSTQTISASSVDESSSIEVNVGSISVAYENNLVAIPALTFKLTYSSTSINGGITANVSLWAGSLCLASHPMSAGRGATTHTVNDAARNVSLPVGTHSIRLVIDYTAAGTAAVSGSLAFTRGSTSRTITYPAEFTMIATDGSQFRYGTEGFKTTETDGAKVIQGGQEYNMAGLGALNSLIAPKRIVFCTSYPNTMESDVFYIKVSSS